MALSDKNIVITPNIGQTADPKIVFSGADGSTGANNITLTAYPTNSGTLSFDGSAGQLFSITNNLTGTLFSVNDISGIPSIEVIDTGLVRLTQYSGRVLLGTGTDNASDKLQVVGNIGATGSIAATNNIRAGTITVGTGATGATGTITASNTLTLGTPGATGYIGATGSIWAIGNAAIGPFGSGAVPTQALHISNASYPRVRVQRAGGFGFTDMIHQYGDSTYFGLTSASGDYSIFLGSGTTTTALGTNQNTPLIFGTNNLERARIDAIGNTNVGSALNVGTLTGATGATGVITATNTIVSTKSIGASGTQGAFAYGTLNYPDGNIMGSWSSNVNSYNQLLLQNTSTGTNASTNFVVSNDQATNSTWYGELGMNSSLFNTGVGGASGASGAFIQPNMVYVAAQSSDLAIGTFSAKPIHFVVNNGANDAMTIASNGTVGIGTSSPLYPLTVQASSARNDPLVTIGSTGAFGGGVGFDVGLLIDIPAYGANTSALHVKSASTSRFFVGNDSYIGAGTVTPKAQMQIHGNGQLVAALTDAGARGGMLRLSDANGSAGSGGAILFANGQSDTANSVGYAAIKGLLSDGSLNTTGDIAFSTRSAAAATSLTERMRINSVGGVNAANYLAVGTLTGATGATGSITATGRISATSGSITTGATGYVGATGSIGAPAGYFNNLFVNGVAVSGGGSTAFSRKTTTYTAVSGDQLIADTTSAGFTITLPATPSSGNYIRIVDGGNFNVNNLTVARNGSTIEGASLDFILDVRGVDVSFVYDGTTWQVYASVGAQGASGVIGASGTIGVNGATGPAGASGAGASITITDDNTTDANYYPMMSAVTSGIASAVYTASSEMYFNPSTGTLSATQFNSLSDEKFKDNFTPIVNSLELINSLKPGSFTWKSNGKKAYGVLAQETELILPEIVDSYDGKKTVSYDQIIPILIQAVKDLQKEIIELKERHDNT